MGRNHKMVGSWKLELGWQAKGGEKLREEVGKDKQDIYLGARTKRGQKGFEETEKKRFLPFLFHPSRSWSGTEDSQIAGLLCSLYISLKPNAKVGVSSFLGPGCPSRQG